MRPLGEIAKVFFGIKTGYNDYFVLDEEKAKEWGIEKEFLVPCVSSPKKVKGLIIRPGDVKEYCFMVGEDQEVPENSNAYKYIKYGEKLEVEVTRGSQRGKRKLPELETLKGRKKWYSLPKLEVANILLPYMIRERFAVWLNDAKAHAPNVFHYFVLQDPQNASSLAAYLNSSIAKLLCELEGRQYTGMLKMETYEWKSFPTINLDHISSDERDRLSRLFFNLAKFTELRLKIEKQYEDLKSKSRKDKGILEYWLEENLKKARKNERNAQKELDEAIYDILGLSQEERRQVEDGLKELQEIRRKMRYS
jgi:adenine-specific DNA-methyltransferase